MVPGPRRILLLIPNLAPGGAETQIADLAEGLAAAGDDVTLACLQEATVGVERLQAAGVRVLALGLTGRIDKARGVRRLARLARAAEVVHCGLWDASLWGRLAAIAVRRPVTVADHSVDRSMQRASSGAHRGRWITWHHRLLAPWTAAVVAVAPSQLSLLRREGIPDRKLVVIPNGVAAARLRAEARHGPTRASLGIPDDAAVVIHVGRLTPEKNQRATVDAVSRIRAATRRDVRAVFVGPGDDQSARHRAADLDAGWAVFLGARRDVPGLLALADLAVLPSVNDTMPMAMLEAFALGVPQVVTSVGDLGATVASAAAGLVVPANDQRAFEEACMRLLTDPALHERAAGGARAAAEAFDVPSMISRYQELFDAAISRRPLPAALRA